MTFCAVCRFFCCPLLYLTIYLPNPIHKTRVLKLVFITNFWAQNKEIRGKASFMRGKGVIRRYRRYESWLIITKCKNVWIVGMKNQSLWERIRTFVRRIQSLEGRIQTFGLRRKGKNFRMKVKILSWNNWDVSIQRVGRKDWNQSREKGLKPSKKGLQHTPRNWKVSNVLEESLGKKKKYSYLAFILFLCCTGHA